MNGRGSRRGSTGSIRGNDHEGISHRSRRRSGSPGTPCLGSSHSPSAPDVIVRKLGPSHNRKSPITVHKRRRGRGKKNLKKIPVYYWTAGVSFPVKGEKDKFVPWAEAETVYRTYVAMYGSLLSLEKIACQGGFTVKEFRVWKTGYDFDGTKIIS